MRGASLVLLAAACLVGAAKAVEPPEKPTLRVGSKKFTESVILGEIAAHLARHAGCEAIHRRELGGTRVVWNALVGGEIDAYVEYTGTLSQEIFAGEGLETEDEIRQALAAKRIRMSRPLGFNNTYAIGMLRERAQALGIEAISDLARPNHADLSFGFSNEFMDREDGWPSLRRRYGLPQKDVRGLEHHLAYRGLASGTIDATDLYSTDAEIAYYDIQVLTDDLGHFPAYEAVLLYRADLAERAPRAVAMMRRLEGAIPEKRMIAMNGRAKLVREPETRVAADFVEDLLEVEVEVREVSALDRFVVRTGEHLTIVGISLAAAVAVAVPLGIVAAKLPTLGQGILGAVGIIQTIPALALLVFMIPLVGIGGLPAMVAVFLYSLLPTVRNTHAGLQGIPLSARESAAALGLPAGARLLLVELPMASPSILAGIKTSAVIIVGMATLGALIGAGGYGQPILTGIRLDDMGLILQGAVPAAGLALLVQGLFELIERLLVPRGLRLKPQT
ncbi:MAG: glycine betaine ABC transporter substrate-binding protein [Planctomycetota bacterium]